MQICTFGNFTDFSRHFPLSNINFILEFIKQKLELLSLHDSSSQKVKWNDFKTNIL